jgi:TetR/AcrR family acrAB operon transcriptional repressor
MPRRTKEAAQKTRSLILDTAEQVFLKKGVSHTTLDDIAAAVGVTRGAIYWHFKNKADLFNGMMKRVSLPMEEMAARAGAAEISDPLGYVRNCALTVLKRLTSDLQCQRVFEICCHKVEHTDEMTPVRARHIECRRACLKRIESGFRNAAKKALLAPQVNPRLAAVGLHALVDGLIVNWVLDPKYLPLAKAARPLVDNYINGLKAPKRRTRSRALKPKHSAAA